MPTDNSPYKFETPWHKFEFAHHALDCDARLVIVSMAWITQEEARLFSRMPQEPDMNTLMYWITRLEPIIRTESDEEVIVVFANRTGTEGEVTYAGTSAVVGIKSGEVRLYGILGRGDKELLVVDTDSEPYAKIVIRPETEALRTEPKKSEPASHRRSESSGTNDSSHASKKSDKASQAGSKSSTKSSSRSTAGSSQKGRQSSNSTYRRDDLSVTVQSKETWERPADSPPPVHTPTAPSPTPHSMRPRLTIPPAHSMTQRYLDSQSPASYVGTPAIPTPALILGGEVKFYGPNSASSISPVYDFESRFSNSTIDSPQTHMKPTPRLPESSRYTPVTETHSLDFDRESEGDNKRHSVRSDVSVWNNYQGRAPNIVAYPSPALQDKSRDKGSSRATSRTPAPESTLHATGTPLPERPSSPKSRHASRSRGLERSNSAAARAPDLESMHRKLEDIANRAESANGFHTPPPPPAHSSGDVGGQNGRISRTESRNQQYTPIHTESTSPGRAMSRMSIPIGMDSSIWPGATDRDATLYHDSSEPAILQAATLERLRASSDSNRGREIERPPTRTAVFQRDPIRSNVPANVGSRQISRGRQPGAESSPNPQVGEAAQQGRRGSRASNEPREPIDLTQFALIEEYPSPNCPVHGTRSRPGTEQGNHSRAEHPLSQDSTPSPKPKHPSQSGIQSTDEIMESTSEPPTRLARRVERPKTSSAVGLGKEVGDSKVAALSMRPFEGTLKTVVLEPKTPKAMVLIHDGDAVHGQERMTLPPLPTAEDDALLVDPRPKSANW